MNAKHRLFHASGPEVGHTFAGSYGLGIPSQVWVNSCQPALVTSKQPLGLSDGMVPGFSQIEA